MTTRLQTLIDEVRTLPNERQEEFADLLAQMLGHDVEVPAWHHDVLAERDAAAGGLREAGVPLDEAIRRVAAKVHA